ncbi:MAG: TRAP transporter fused permease subunit [Pseudomonadota bacterium]
MPDGPDAVSFPEVGGDGVEAPLPTGLLGRGLGILCVLYAGWHLYVLNIAPLETWTFRILHVAGTLGLGFAVTALARTGSVRGCGERGDPALSWVALGLALVGAAGIATSCAALGALWLSEPPGPDWATAAFGWPLAVGTLAAILAGWIPEAAGRGARRMAVAPQDVVLIGAVAVATGFIVLSLEALNLRLRAGTPFADPNNGFAAFALVVLILELTRRVAGLALVIIAGVFIAYSFIGPWLPGFLEHRGYDARRFFTYIYTDNGVLGPTTAVSSTYIILFIVFAAFLQRSKVGDYFVDCAFAAAGHLAGGPAKVSVFASGLMGMINGTSAGNVVSTGALTIPLMKRVGYRPQSAGAIEAAASTGGQIMPPIMGAGAFIMAEITGIPYTDLVIAALVPALLYFASIYFMVDFEARRMGLGGVAAEELPRGLELLKRVYLFIPILILIGAIFVGYSVIRAGTLAIVSAAVVSWLTPHAMGPRRIVKALGEGARMSIQIITVCACAGLIVGVISLTGVGARFSALLFDLAETSQLLALFFAMVIAVILGMGMPTTAAYAVAASVVAPGLIEIGIEPLVAHFFVFYFAVVSAITPPVALAAYAGAAIAGSEPMRTSIASFRVGLAAFIVPFMFFYSPGLLMEGAWHEILRNALTGLAGVAVLAAAVQGWFAGVAPGWMRLGLLAVAIALIAGDWRTDLLGILLFASLFAVRRFAPSA